MLYGIIYDGNHNAATLLGMEIFFGSSCDCPFKHVPHARTVEEERRSAEST